MEGGIRHAHERRTSMNTILEGQEGRGIAGSRGSPRHQRVRSGDGMAPSPLDYEERSSSRSRRRSSQDSPAQLYHRRMSDEESTRAPRQRRATSSAATPRGQRGWDRDEDEDQGVSGRQRGRASRHGGLLQVLPLGGGGKARRRLEEYEVEDIEDTEDTDDTMGWPRGP
jgi:hypothetical protein